MTTNQYTYSISYSSLDTIANTGLQQIVNFPTRNNNTQDVVLTNHPSLTKQYVGMPGLSDHNIVFVETSSRALRHKPAHRKILLCKLWEHILHSTILTHLANHKILSDAQHGFKKRRSCDTQLLLALNDFARGLEDKSQSDIIFLDFAKAFDKVSHQGLLKKPITMVFVDIPINGLKVFLTTAHSRW